MIDDGELFEHIYLLKIGDSYTARKDYYTVLNGQVVNLSKGGTDPTGDTIMRLSIDGVYVGKYDATKRYESEFAEYSHKQLRRKLFAKRQPK